jgi:ABC-type Mn2+/Zn2+ transport system permease subunit
MSGWAELREMLPLYATGLWAGALVAVLCSFIGVYVVLKRIVFVGVSLAQISAAGIALAFLIGQKTLPWAGAHPLEFSMIVTLVGVLIYSQQGQSRRIPRESAIGIGYLIGSALTVIFIARTARGIHEVEELLYGNIIAVSEHDLRVVWTVAIIAIAAHLLFYKQFLFVSYDRDTAATQGYKVRLWELLFYVILGITIAVAIQAAGLLTAFGCMVIPPVIGLMVARRMFTAFAVSIVVALISSGVGFYFSLQSDVLPTSPPSIACMAVILAAVWAIKQIIRDPA